MASLKHDLHTACTRSLQDKIKEAEQNIRHIQEAANEETKSSAGDKYETGRAMAQLEIEKLSLQLAELRKAVQELTRISPEQKSECAAAGSLLFTNRGNFYISVNAGQFTLENTNIYTVSVNAPIAQKASGLFKNDTFSLNGKDYTISAIE